MKVTVDRAACCGAGQCVMIAPEVFDQDEDDGIVILRTADVPPGDEEAARKAAKICPARAIRTVDAG